MTISVEPIDGPVAPAPLFRDPIYDGAADPCLIWNREEQSWWIVYTSRRANLDGPGVAYCHGTEIGVCSSSDSGRSWRYRGTLEGLEFERGRNTFWAPEIVCHEGTYHMFVSYVSGVPSVWSETNDIVHMVSTNLWQWTMKSVLTLSSRRVIDAAVCRIENGQWRLWYKDGAHGSHTYAADSDDLTHWTVAGPVITNCPHEGPNVFRWRDSYWMVVDTWHGLGVYRSNNGLDWVDQGTILEAASSRPDDGPRGHHADVLVQGDAAWVFYFTHPGRDKDFQEPEALTYAQRRSSLQVARLTLKDNRPVCLRDGLRFALKPGADG